METSRRRRDDWWADLRCRIFTGTALGTIAKTAGRNRAFGRISDRGVKLMLLESWTRQERDS